MSRGRYPRLISNREKIFQLTDRAIPLTRRRKDGTEYIVSPKPICSKCKVPVRNLYQINEHYRKENIPRFEHVGYRCPKCDSLFSRRLIEKDVEVFDGDFD